MPIQTSDIGRVLGPEKFAYTEDDVILYALAVGAEADELELVYERDLRPLPTFAVIPARSRNLNASDALGLDYTKLLHGENRIELARPLPPKASFSATNTVKAIHDKGPGKGAVVITELEARLEDGSPLYKNTSSIFVRGEGGFGGERGPSGAKNIPPERAPDAVITMQTGRGQAQLYRLCGDKNLLHVDPEFAKASGFERPILHGLCSYGFCARAVLRAFCGGDPRRMRAFEARFSGVVFPGDAITVEMWRDGGDRVLFQAGTSPGRQVITGGLAEFFPEQGGK